MRVTISHKKDKQEIMKTVDRSVDDVFKNVIAGPVQISDQKKSWNGSVMTFSLVAKMGFISNPISGTIEVTDKDLTIDADLGMLNHLIPEKKVRETVEAQVRKLLPG